MKRSLFVILLIAATSLAQSQTAPKGLNIHDMAPDFSGTDQNGKRVNLKESLATGPVVLVFYRGHWCPYCNQYLKKLEDSMSLFVDKGAKLITITPETTDGISKTITKTKASYPIISDSSLYIMKSYDVAFPVPEKTIERYKNFGIDFQKANGNANGANLPVPAVYVINKDGLISYRHFDPDYTRRVSVAEILSHL